METGTNGALSPERLLQFAWGFAPMLIIEAALAHRLFDLLEAAPRTAPEVAAAAGLAPRGVKILLNALVGLQLARRSGDRYALTDESSAFLVSTKPAFHGGIFQHFQHQLLPNWLQLRDILRAGKPLTAVNAQGDGAEFFKQFVEAIFPLSFPAAQKLAEHLDLNHAPRTLSVLDLGAGSGVWGIALAKQSPQVRICAVDWPDVLEVTRQVARRHGVADRLTTVPGDLLTAEFGTGHQVATIGHILHSEGVERSQRLLRRTFDALASGGTVAIMEFLCNDDRTGPPSALMFAINMLVHTEVGDTFTFPEISGWLRNAGFVNPRLLEVPAVSPLVLATKP